MPYPFGGSNIDFNTIHRSAGGASGTQGGINDSDVRDLTGSTAGTQISFADFDLPATGNLVLYADAGNYISYPSAAGSTWNDLSSQNNDVTWSGTPSTVNTAPRHFLMNAVNTAGPFGSTNIPTGSSSRSMGIWIYVDQTFNQFRVGISYGTGGYRQAYFIGQNYNAVMHGGWADDIVTSSWVNQQWYFIFTTFDGTTASLYRDNVLLSSANKSAWNTGTSDYQVGKQISPASEYWDGAIAAVMIYDKVLSSTERTDLYDAVKKRYGH